MNGRSELPDERAKRARFGRRALVGQRLWWMPVAIPGFGRAYYEIPNMPVADNYRVTVWAYERIQGRDGGMVIR